MSLFILYNYFMNFSDEMNKEALVIPVNTGSVTATIWRPTNSPQGVIVVHPATATPQRFYTAFAEYMAEAGFITLTYDYRGTGRSGEPCKNPDVRMRDWMSEDVPAVAEFVLENFNGLPAYAVGHSIGGHAMVLGYGTEHLQKFVIVSSHIAATKKIASYSERLRVTAVLNGLGPAMSRMFGYMPGRLTGLGEDMPKAAMIEWGRWARKQGYFFDDPSMQAGKRAASVEKEVLALGSTDDPWSSPAQIDALTARMRLADVDRRTIYPKDLKVDKIGHHGLLRKGIGEPVWSDILQWLREGKNVAKKQK